MLRRQPDPHGASGVHRGHGAAADDHAGRAVCAVGQYGHASVFLSGPGVPAVARRGFFLPLSRPECGGGAVRAAARAVRRGVGGAFAGAAGPAGVGAVEARGLSGSGGRQRGSPNGIPLRGNRGAALRPSGRRGRGSGGAGASRRTDAAPGRPGRRAGAGSAGGLRLCGSQGPHHPPPLPGNFVLLYAGRGGAFPPLHHLRFAGLRAGQAPPFLGQGFVPYAGRAAGVLPAGGRQARRRSFCPS